MHLWLTTSVVHDNVFLQVVFGEVIQVGPEDNMVQVLVHFLSDRLLKNCQIVDTYSHPTASHSFREGSGDTVCCTERLHVHVHVVHLCVVLKGLCLPCKVSMQHHDRYWCCSLVSFFLSAMWIH